MRRSGVRSRLVSALVVGVSIVGGSAADPTARGLFHHNRISRSHTWGAQIFASDPGELTQVYLRDNVFETSDADGPFIFADPGQGVRLLDFVDRLVIDGNTFRLSSLRGHKVVIVSWAPY